MSTNNPENVDIEMFFSFLQCFTFYEEGNEQFILTSWIDVILDSLHEHANAFYEHVQIIGRPRLNSIPCLYIQRERKIKINDRFPVYKRTLLTLSN
jgi:hypothetical protein